MSRENTRQFTVSSLHMQADNIETAISLMTRRDGRGGCDTHAVRMLLDVCDFLRGQMLAGSRAPKVSTDRLVQELKTRDGVTTKYADPYENLQINVNGPAVVLIVVD